MNFPDVSKKNLFSRCFFIILKNFKIGKSIVFVCDDVAG